MASTERPDDPVARSRDVDDRGVLLFGFWLVVATVLVSLAMWGLFRVLGREESAHQRPVPPMIAANLQRTPPEPRLEANPVAPLRRMRAEEDAILMGYAWVDRTSGTVRIPIERAMELIAQRGLPPAQPMPAGTSGSASSAAAPPNPNPAAPPPAPGVTP